MALFAVYVCPSHWAAGLFRPALYRTAGESYPHLYHTGIGRIALFTRISTRNIKGGGGR
jgi:hypothetical protein